LAWRDFIIWNAHLVYQTLYRIRFTYTLLRYDTKIINYDDLTIKYRVEYGAKDGSIAFSSASFYYR
jgi:hypothetical protein